MKALIADDEPIARQNLRELLEEFPDVRVVGEAASGEEAIEQTQRTRPDVVFLDLQMPGLDGFGVARALGGEGFPAVVYVTAYAEHALEAFDVGAVDYLLKPVRPKRMSDALGRVRARLAGRRAGPDHPAGEAPFGKIPGRRGRDIHLFDASEVVAFLADGDWVQLVTANGRFDAGRTMKELERDLPRPPFRRVHRRAIINSSRIRRLSPLSSKRWLLTMDNGLEVTVSKRLAGLVRRGA